MGRVKFNMIIFAGNFRGFKNVEIDTSKSVFLVGENSSGKSSLLYLIDAIHLNDLDKQMNTRYFASGVTC